MDSPKYALAQEDKEGPQFSVRLNAVHISKYEVTFDEYDAFVTATSRGFPDDEGWGQARHSVINCSYYDARFLVSSEFEWEYTVLAHTVTPYRTSNHCGPGKFQRQLLPSRGGVIDRETSGVNRGNSIPVGSFPVNAFTFHDVHGNVRRLTCSSYNDSYNGSAGSCAPFLGSGQRVMHGNSYNFTPQECSHSKTRQWKY